MNSDSDDLRDIVARMVVKPSPQKVWVDDDARCHENVFSWPTWEIVSSRKRKITRPFWYDVEENHPPPRHHQHRRTNLSSADQCPIQHDENSYSLCPTHSFSPRIITRQVMNKAAVDPSSPKNSTISQHRQATPSRRAKKRVLCYTNDGIGDDDEDDKIHAVVENCSSPGDEEEGADESEDKGHSSLTLPNQPAEKCTATAPPGKTYHRILLLHHVKDDDTRTANHTNCSLTKKKENVLRWNRLSFDGPPKIHTRCIFRRRGGAWACLFSWIRRISRLVSSP